MDYATLKTTIADWIVHDDAEAKADDLIDMFEAWANRHMRIHEAEDRISDTVPVGETWDYVALPTLWNGARAIRPYCKTATQLTPDQLDRWKVIDPSGTSCDNYYTIEDQALRFHPPLTENTELEILYWRKVPALDDVTTTNWLIEAHPDYYLYGSLYFGGVYIKSPEYLQLVTNLFQQIQEDIKIDSERKIHTDGPLKMRTV